MPGSAPVAGDTIVNKAKSLLLHHVHSEGTFCARVCVSVWCVWLTTDVDGAEYKLNCLLSTFSDLLHALHTYPLS